MDADVTVVGAGIVGLASALAIRRRSGGQVVVLDKEPGPARHQTGRNSGVVHSGLYYAPGSTKARLIATGRRLLAERAREGGPAIEWCGKVVVATRITELAALAALEQRGRANGVEVRPLSPQALARLEPHVTGVAALHVPDAGITDFGAHASAIAAELVEQGATLQFGSAVQAIEDLGPGPGDGDGGGLRVVTSSGTLRTRWLVNCAGLQSDRIARLAGCDTAVRIVPFRGEYHQLSADASPLVRNLVYPVPDPRWPFLGVHATRMVDGSVHVGPNAILALGREAYAGGLTPGSDAGADLADLARTRGLWWLAGRYWRTGAAELVRSRSRRLLLRELRRLLPEVAAADLEPAGAGIRAQAIAPDGTLLDDFTFASSRRAVHVLNAPSPAATASLAIGEVVAARLEVARSGR